jgi:DNA-binding response OmpR family regulator
VHFLESQGCEVRGVDGRADLVRLTRLGKWSLIVLTSRPPSTEGLEQLRRIRSQSSVPILFEGMCSPIDRIVALELGADCHVPRSAELQEMWALARSILRRQDIGRLAPDRERERGGFSFAGWELTGQTARWFRLWGSMPL